MRYEKGSFLTIPNKHALRGADTVVQVVYMWICSFADEKGVCFPSRNTLANCAGCSVKTVDRSIELLCDAGLLKKVVRRQGTKNLTNLYQLMIVEEGSDSQSLPSDSQSLGVASQSPTELNPVLTKSTQFSADAPIVETPIDQPEVVKRESKAKYPHALEVFSWFPNRQKSWESMKNIQEREYAEYLYERGEETVKKALAYVRSQSENPEFRYVVVKPSDLEKKWEDIKTYAKRNS